MSEIFTRFPNDFASNSEKSSPKYGKQVAEAFVTPWYNGGGLSLRRSWIDKMRSYSKGEQSTDYRTMIEGDRRNKDNKIQVKTHKIDYTEQLKILPVFKDIITNSIDESLFKPRAEAIDLNAINSKKNYFKKLDEDFYTQDFAQIISQGIGVDITNPNLPKTSKDLEIRKLEYKPRIEIAQELSIESILRHEKFETIKDKVDEDLFDLGIGILRHYTDKTEGIKFKYVDPYNFVHNSFETEDGRDIRCAGVIEKGTITDLLKQSDGNISQEQLLAIKNYALNDLRNLIPYTDSIDGERMIEYVSFAYLVGESRIFKKRNKYKYTKLIDRTDGGFEPVNENKKLEIPYSTWYEGIYIPTANVLIKWEKVKNQIEEGINNPVCPFIVYAPKVKRISEKGHVRFDSMVQRSIPIIDDIQRDWYKFQQLKMELRPNSVTISPRALNSVSLNGKRVLPQDVLDMFFGRGVLLADEVDEDGEPIGRAIREENGGINNSALIFLSNEFSNNYERLRKLLGINELRDGTTQPNSKTAVTVQKLLLASSNNATNHIVKGSFAISLRASECASLRLYDVLTTKVLKDMYMSIIGSSNVELLDAIKELPMHRFGIYFDFRPDNEERIAFEQSLVNSYNQKEINVAQYNKSRQIRNVKSAIKYLETIIDENIKQQEEFKRINIEKQAEANARTSVITEQTKQQTITIEYETKKNLLILGQQLTDESKRKDALTKDILDQRAHQRALELMQLQNQGLIGKKETEIEGRKELLDKNSTNQSKMIEQRNTDSGAIDFTAPKSNDFEKELNDIFNKEQLLTNDNVSNGIE